MADNSASSHGVAQSARFSYEHARQAAAHVRDRATDYVAKGRDKVRAVENSAEEFIRARPLKSILTAAGLGVMVGLLLRRR